MQDSDDEVVDNQSVSGSHEADIHAKPDNEISSGQVPASQPNHQKSARGHETKTYIIIKKKIKKKVHGHHGGAWKIAYADFVTAMMTFFLLMWLLSMLNKYQLEGISAYFKNPSMVDSKVQINQKGDKVKTDVTETTEELNKPAMAENQADKKEPDMTAEAEMKKLKSDIDEKIKNNPILSEYKNALDVQVVRNGLRIEMHELKGKPMFSNGEADFQAYAKDILSELAKEMNNYPNRVMIIGHTDNKPINKERYTNWELSSDRANAARLELVGAGMDVNKIVRTAGVADTDKIDGTEGDDPINRRIVIMVLTKDAYDKMKEE